MAAALLLLSGCSHEAADWKKATGADSTDSYQQFLKDHPSSSYAAAANARIRDLMTDRDWQTAASTDTREAYEAFIAQHADSKWVQEARIRIENFAQAGGATASAAESPPPAPSVAHASAPKTSPAAGNPSHIASSSGAHAQMVQLGAFSTRERAQSQWKRLSAKFPTELKSLKPDYQQTRSKSGVIYRLRVPVSSVAAAKGLCGTLRKHAQTCVLVTTPT